MCVHVCVCVHIFWMRVNTNVCMYVFLFEVRVYVHACVWVLSDRGRFSAALSLQSKNQKSFADLEEVTLNCWVKTLGDQDYFVDNKVFTSPMNCFICEKSTCWAVLSTEWPPLNTIVRGGCCLNADAVNSIQKRHEYTSTSMPPGSKMVACCGSMVSCHACCGFCFSFSPFSVWTYHPPRWKIVSSWENDVLS